MPPTIPTTPLREIPAWAILQRRLFTEIEASWPVFSEKYSLADGRLRFDRSLRPSRDGVDDFYESFFNWPAFYALGGSDAILAAAKHHWEGVTAQLTEDQMLTGEYENGYDWFHQGESLIFFYALCAADPDDERFRERAHCFARLYTDPAAGNYDPEVNVIKAPHTGALGALEGLGPEWQNYSAEQTGMEPYGLPIEGLDGIATWDDLFDPEKAHRMGQEMQRRAQGDVAVNLAATSLVVNSWLYDGDPAAAAWVTRYVDGWRERAAANGGMIPDNVGPDGVVGSLQDGRWYGGHYGWHWPHGIPSVVMGALIGGINARLVSGDDCYLDLARVPLDESLRHAITGTVRETPASLQGNWLSRLGADADVEATLIPQRIGDDGWFDFGPMPLDLPTWLWWVSRDPADRERLRRVVRHYPESPTAVKPFRDKAESGHEAPWLSFLDGENPDYPVRALEMALGQVARRNALVASEDPDPRDVHIHFWQTVNPVVTEVLQQLITGAPQVLYNGGLPLCAISYTDSDRGRPGLPEHVAALVTRLDGSEIDVELVNTSSLHTRRVLVRPGRFGESDITNVVAAAESGGVFPGGIFDATSIPGEAVAVDIPVGDAEVLVVLPPAHRARLTLHIAPSTRSARHYRAAARRADPPQEEAS